ncbi:hypothetical protein M2322_004336 [Rhodoblastus acidophilus]|uniref:hypothetical protein n=1 Tax=Rhodoblastus acidophilus TaxID=1074 RepID=UPI002224DA3D|nr:hypothetical protein [Rhodoblastus acidophilus]MCW2318767.1 hypothetical protein [Rhodoblastus acidophilus]
MIEAQAPIDFEWLTRPYTGLFQEADPSDETIAVVAYRGDSIRFMNPQKDWVRVTYECAFDADKQKVTGVRIRPGRLTQPPAAASLPQTQVNPRKPTNENPQQVKAAPLAAAIAEAVRNRQQQAQAQLAPKTIKFGEPTAIDIEQVDPHRLR